MLSNATMPAEGDSVVLYFAHSDMRVVKLTKGDRVSCRAGFFEHDAVLKTGFGCRVIGKPQARTDPVWPQAVVMRLTPELWTQCLRHRTQIIYTTDIAVIITHLRLQPGKIVAEAGTGSGSLTHALARAVAPQGKVYTYDFHVQRALEAATEFKDHGLETLIESNWADVCRTNYDRVRSPGPLVAGTETEPPSGYGLAPSSVDAVFLDVPAPWLAVENVLHVVRCGGAVCSYSPCIEQTHKFCAALRATDEFLDLHTLECLTKDYVPVFPSIRSKRERPAEGIVQPVHRGEGVELVPRPDAKGHSAFLTFARRRTRST